MYPLKYAPWSRLSAFLISSGTSLVCASRPAFTISSKKYVISVPLAVMRLSSLYAFSTLNFFSSVFSMKVRAWSSVAAKSTCRTPVVFLPRVSSFVCRVNPSAV